MPLLFHVMVKTRHKTLGCNFICKLCVAFEHFFSRLTDVFRNCLCSFNNYNAVNLLSPRRCRRYRRKRKGFPIKSTLVWFRDYHWRDSRLTAIQTIVMNFVISSMTSQQVNRTSIANLSLTDPIKVYLSMKRQFRHFGIVGEGRGLVKFYYNKKHIYNA